MVGCWCCAVPAPSVFFTSFPLQSAHCTTRAQLREIHQLTCFFLSFHSQIECADAGLNSDYSTTTAAVTDLATSYTGSNYCEKRYYAPSCYCATGFNSDDKVRGDGPGEVCSAQAPAPISRAPTPYVSPSKACSAPTPLNRFPTPYVSPTSSYKQQLSLPMTTSSGALSSSSTDFTSMDKSETTWSDSNSTDDPSDAE
jgi:hypothetical protein